MFIFRLTIYKAAVKFAFLFGASWMSWSVTACAEMQVSSLAELTLLIVIVVTVVPAVLLMVLGIVPEAPTELCQDTTP